MGLTACTDQEMHAKCLAAYNTACLSVCTQCGLHTLRNTLVYYIFIIGPYR